MKPGFKYFYTSIEQQSKMGGSTEPLMVSVDCSAWKYFIYSKAGLLLKRVEFFEDVEKYGVPIDVSPNGKIFIFQDQHKPSSLTIMELTFDSMRFVKTVNVNQAIKKYIEDCIDTCEDMDDFAKAKKMRYALDGDYQTYFIENNVHYEFDINDNRDLIVQISNKLEIELFDQIAKTFPDDDERDIIR